MTDHTDLDLLDRVAVAARLGKSVKQISNMQARGQIPAPIAIPGIGVRWSRQGLEQWLASAIVTASRRPRARPQPAPASQPAAEDRLVAALREIVGRE